MLIKRQIFDDLKKQVKLPEIVVLTGMRRVGKTTLYQMIFDIVPSANKVFIDIENPIEQMIFDEKDYNNIWANLKTYGITNSEKAYIFLDEIQEKPEIVKAIKYLYDHYNVKFFVTGSSSFYLKNLFPESLAGRKVTFELYPLDFEEFCIFKNHKIKFKKSFSDKLDNKNIISFETTKAFYDEYIEFGGFPQVVLTEDNEHKKRQISDIFKSYFQKDVMQLADFRNINAFRDLMLLLFQRVGSKLDISKLASETGVSRISVYSYLSFLQGTYFIDLISPISNNVDREVSGSKKVYICDTGIINHFAKVSEGALFENAVFLNLRKYGKTNYYQKRSGAEIDFILSDKNIALEVKSTGSEKDYSKLKKISQKLNCKEQYIISRKFSEYSGVIPALYL